MLSCLFECLHVLSVSRCVLLLCEQSVRELLEMADHRWQRRSEASNRAYGDNVTAVVAKITNILESRSHSGHAASAVSQ